MKKYAPDTRWAYIHTFILNKLKKNLKFESNQIDSIDLNKIKSSIKLKKAAIEILENVRNGQKNAFHDKNFIPLVLSENTKVHKHLHVITKKDSFDNILDNEFLHEQCNDEEKVINALNDGLEIINNLNEKWASNLRNSLTSVVGVEDNFDEINSGFTHDIPGFINLNINASSFVISEQLVHELTHLMFDDILFFEKKSRIFVKDLPPVFSIFVNKPRTAELVLHGLFSYTSVYIFWDQVHKHYPNLKKTAKNRMNEVISYIKQASKDLNNILTKNEWNKVYNIYKNICPLAERHLWEVKPNEKYTRATLKNISDYLNDLELAELSLAILGNKVSRISISLDRLKDFHSLLNRLPVNYCLSSYLFESETDSNISDFKNVISEMHNLDTYYRPTLEVHIYFSKYKSLLKKAFLLDQSDDCASLFKTPDCCEIFFKENWNDAVEKYQGDLTRTYYDNEKNIEINPIYNPVSMYFEKGLCWHFSCSLTCKKTKQMIDKRISLLKKHEPDLLNRLMEIKDYKIIYKNQKCDMVSIK